MRRPGGVVNKAPSIAAWSAPSADPDFARFLSRLGPQRLRGTSADALSLARAHDDARLQYWRDLLSFGERHPEVEPTFQEHLIAEIGFAPRDEPGARTLLRRADAGFALSADLPGASRSRGLVVRARNAAAEANLGLVASIARRYAGLFGGSPAADLFQEGAIGLMQALDTFDPDRGLLFSTFAAWWIRRAVCNAAAKAGTVLGVPQKGFAAVRSLALQAELFAAEYGRDPDDGELASRLGVGPVGLASMRAAAVATLPASPLGRSPCDGAVVDAAGVERSRFTAAAPVRPDDAHERAQLAGVVVHALAGVDDDDRRVAEAVAGVASWQRVRKDLRPARRADGSIALGLRQVDALARVRDAFVAAGLGEAGQSSAVLISSLILSIPTRPPCRRS